MRVVIAPDSFKESLSAVEACDAIAAGLRRAWPDAELHLVPMADGGEGTVEAFVTAAGGEYVHANVTGPLGEPVSARYAIVAGGETAIIEMAAASGLPLVRRERRDVGRATTYGTGELIDHALAQGARRVMVGLGGSATCDGGAGMAQALGFALLDEDGAPLPPGGLALTRLRIIRRPIEREIIERATFTAICDVDNPLCGPRGAARVYGPQKGADPPTVAALDEALAHFAKVVADQLGVDVREVPGTGAAGGLGAGMIGFLGAELVRGVDAVAEVCKLEEKLARADLVITGEGRMDAQSANGKTPVGVARLARRAGVPVLALAGALGDGYEAVYAAGIDTVFPILSKPVSLDDALANAARYLSDAAERAARLWETASRQSVRAR